MHWNCSTLAGVQPGVSTTPLSVLRLDLPCQVPWDDMAVIDGDESVRFCTQCRLNVHNLSAMTAEEAKACLARQTDRVCVSFLQAADGRAITLEYQPVNRSRRRWQRAAVAAALVAATGGATVAAMRKPPPAVVPAAPPPVPVAQLSGGICAPSPVPYVPPMTAAAAPPVAHLAIQLQRDTRVAPIAARLPAGVEVIDLQYNVFPAGLTAGHGVSLVLGPRPRPGEPTPPAPAASARAIVWLMPRQYADSEDLSQPTDRQHPLRLAARNDQHDVLIWCEDAELERLIVAATEQPQQ